MDSWMVHKVKMKVRSWDIMTAFLGTSPFYVTILLRPRKAWTGPHKSKLPEAERLDSWPPLERGLQAAHGMVAPESRGITYDWHRLTCGNSGFPRHAAIVQCARRVTP